MRTGMILGVLFLALLAMLTALPPIHADEPAIRPGEGIAPLRLGEQLGEIGRALGRPFGKHDVGGCGGSYQWMYQESDTMLSAGEDAVVWTPIISGRQGDRADAITIEGERGKLTTAGGVGLGSSSHDVIAEFGPPSHERPDGDGTDMLYESRGIQFLTRSDVVRAVTIFWPLLKSLDVQPFSGIGPVSLGMEAPRAAEAMGRPNDLVTPSGREAWSLPVAQGDARGGCDPYLALRTVSGKVQDVFTNAAGFRTPGGVQIGDSIDGLVKELGSGHASSGPVGDVLWTSTKGTPAKFVVGYRTSEDGVKRILYFWLQAY